MNKQNSGYFAANKYKKEEKHPDYKGFVGTTCPNCGNHTDYQIAGWKKTKVNEQGEEETYLSLNTSMKLPPKEQAPAQAGESAAVLAQTFKKKPAF